MKALYLDCFSGISGDMLLAGMFNLGLDRHRLEGLFRHAGLDVTLRTWEDVRCGLAGTRLEVHSNAVQPLRHLPDILALLETLRLPHEVMRRAARAFQRLATVEAAVHGVDPTTIHFHEVGAMDTIVDVVGTFLGLDELGITTVQAGSLPWFQGQVHSAHGLLPLPAPAVVELLRGKPVFRTDHDVELITPTGALLLDQMVHDFGTGPQGILLRCGIGLGAMDLDKQPNALRCLLYDRPSSPETTADTTFSEAQSCDTSVQSGSECTEEVLLLTTNIDHLTGEELGNCFEILFQSGAVDVLYLPGTMKKNRPGGQLQVLCRPERLAEVQRAVFRETMSLGVRRQRMERVVLPRCETNAETAIGEMPVKQTEMEGARYSRPEFEALRELAGRTGRSVAQLRYLLDTPAGPEANETREGAYQGDNARRDGT